MTDREKLLTAMECVAGRANFSVYVVEAQCRECPYDDSTLWSGCDEWAMIVDALALLKEQEPRVMTREEVMDLLQGSVAWYEEKSESGTYLRALVSDGNGFLGDFYLGINAHEFDFKRGRFWTARPSDEQRKAVKWDD